jgi:hypothetical protein
MQRLAEAERERDRLQQSFNSKVKERETKKEKLLLQAKRNRPELKRFCEKLGLRLSAGGGGGINATKTASQTIKFTFNLINPDDYAYEAHLVIDMSQPMYKSEFDSREEVLALLTIINVLTYLLFPLHTTVLSHSPAIPQDKLDEIVLELNTHRTLYNFIRRMRTEFMEEIKRSRMAKRAARRVAGI